MKRDDRRRADALDRYWDATQRGETPSHPRDVDDLAVAIVAHLDRDTSRPDVTGPQLRVRQRIAPAAQAADETPDPSLSIPAAGLPGERTGPGRSAENHRFAPDRRILPRLATAALLLLALALGYHALAPRSGGPSISIPAVSGPPATVLPAPTPPSDASPEATSQILVAVAVPSNALAGGVASSALSDQTLPSGGRATVRELRKAQLLYLLSGAVTIETDGAMRVQRAGRFGTWEDFGTSVAISLGPGDAALVLHPTSIAVGASGSGPAELLSWTLDERAAAATPIPADWIVHDEDLTAPNSVSLPSVSSVLQLRRVDLPPGNVAAAPSAAFVSVSVTRVETTAGTPRAASIERRANGSIANAGSAPVTVYVVTMVPFGATG